MKKARAIAGVVGGLGAMVLAMGSASAQVAGAATGAASQLPGVVNGVGQTANGVVGGLQPTLQPVGQGVGSALNNITQPQTISSLLDFLAGVIPNHIEAHVNLDSLRVDKLTVDIRGVDLRNLRVDLLVANSRNGAGPVQQVLNTGQNSGRSSTSGGFSNGAFGGFGGTGSGNSGNIQPMSGTGSSQYVPLPGDVPIAGSSTRGQ